MSKLLKRSLALLMVTFLPLLAQAQAQTPSDASIDTLFKVTDVEATLKASLADADEMAKNMLVNMLQDMGTELNEAQQKVVGDGVDKMMIVWTDMFGWDALKPSMVKVYKELYTQEEVDAMIEFYQTPVGRSIISKQAQATKRVTNLMTEGMQKAVLKIVDIQKEISDGIKALEK